MCAEDQHQTEEHREYVETYKDGHIPWESLVGGIEMAVSDTCWRLRHNCPITAIPTIDTTMQRILA